MAVSGKIADGVIKIALAGLEATKAQLAQLQGNVKKLNESLGTIGSASAKGFAVATGGITGFLKAADPVRFEVFSQKLQVLAMYIGISFIPILDQAIAVVDQLIEVFKNLSNDQREQILHWTKVATGILAAGTAIGGVVSVLPKLIGLIRAVQVAVSILTTSTGVGIVLALVGAALAVLQLTGGFERFQPVLDKLQAAFGKFVDGALGPLMDVLVEIGSSIAESFGSILSEIAPVFAQLGSEFGKLAKEALPILAELGKQLAVIVGQIAGVVAKLIPPFIQVAIVFQKLYVQFYATLAKVFLAIAQAVVAVLPALVQVIEVLTEVVEALAPVFAELAEVFGEVLGLVAELIGEILKLAGEAVAELIKACGELFKQFWKAFGPDIISLIRGMLDVFKEWVSGFRTAVADAKTGLNDIKLGFEVIKAVVNSFVDDLVQLVLQVRAVGEALWEAFGPSIKTALEVVVSFAQDILSKIEQIVAAAKGLVSLLDSINPFSSGDEGKPSGRGDFRGGSGSGGSIDIGPDRPAGNGSTWLRDAFRDAKNEIANIAGTMGGAGGNPTDPNRFAPMARPVKVETFGIEDAFKRAQQGASFDPAKIAENERKKIMEDQLAETRAIRQNTSPRPGAEFAR